MRTWIACVTLAASLTACGSNVFSSSSGATTGRGSSLSSGVPGRISAGGVLIAVGGVLVFAVAAGELPTRSDEEAVSTGAQVGYLTLGGALIGGGVAVLVW